MSQPAPYLPTHAFLSDEAQASWFPGQQLDVEFNNVKTSVGQIETNLALIQRDDGALANGSVTFNSLSPMLQAAGVSPNTAAAISVTPTGGISSVNAQNALAELDTEKAAIASLASVAFSGAGIDMVTNSIVWTPVLTFATPGDLAVAYTTQAGRYWQISSNLLLVQYNITTSSFAFTTASGALELTGLPFTTHNTIGLVPRGGLSYTGINKTGYSQIAAGIGVNSSVLIFNASGMGVTSATVTAADTPTGGTVTLIGELILFL